MLDTDSLEEYILSHSDPEPPWLRDLYRKAHIRLVHPRMLSGHLQGRFLKMLTQMIRPQNVLEIGTYTGYSALCIAEGLTGISFVYTIEKDDEMEDFIREAFAASPYDGRICLYIGDAAKIVPAFAKDFFGMVFIDADKREYWEHYELILPKVLPGGYILVDNTLWSGKVLEKTPNNDWQTKGILEFNEKLAADDRVEKVILPIRDGLTLIRKKDRRWKQTDS
ncbi:O-methyltransferase [Limibacterium fermenti]|uniref:O-methyltransferase n=1 Tax=Limibacterium fermenti TaxID=3229863 RepID=UPI000E9A9E0A|nr:methyltransferase [Porphyromonadaceae bacterium]HBX45015.1 methyltransferase [Porphyromonadaceae bacterium]